MSTPGFKARERSQHSQTMRDVLQNLPTMSGLSAISLPQTSGLASLLPHSGEATSLSLR